MIEFNELVPFRLTRNMQAFFLNFGVEGLIVSAMCSAAQSVVLAKVSINVSMLIHFNSRLNFCRANRVNKKSLLFQSTLYGNEACLVL
jgi:phosphatidylinositol kinase/protein kinase (PI-3  family)